MPKSTTKIDPDTVAPRPQAGELKMQPPGQQIEMVRGVFIPIEQFNDVVDAVKEAPYKTAKPVLTMARGLQIIDLPVEQKPSNGD